MTKFITCLLLLSLGSTLPPQHPASRRESRYPNELIGYRLYAGGHWKSLTPYVSRRDDVHRVLGEPSPVLMPYDSHWEVIVFYFESATINGKPWGEPLKGTVASINFRPRFPMSFKDVGFPPEFTCSDTYSSHSPAPTKKCSDGSGLSYRIYIADSVQDNIRAGDLVDIEYGPPR